MRSVRRLVLGACVLALFGTAATPAGAAGKRIDVWFVRDGGLEKVTRRVGGIEGAVRALLAGPNAREHSRGLRSAVPRRTPLRAVTVSRRVVTVDLGARFAAGRDDATLRARVAQLVRTVSSVPGVAGVRVLVEGGVPLGLFPGFDLRRPLRPASVALRRGPSTRELQWLLVDLGFLDPSGATGVVDDRTTVAVLEFEKWVGLPRDGALEPATVRALQRATRPRPVTRGPGRRVEILLDRQLALLVEAERVLRAVHISSGAGGATPTGRFRVYRKERLSWSVPFSVWMPWASYFVGGMALHEYPIVPVYPASHGCVRVNRYDAPFLYEFATHGTPVIVLWSSQGSAL
jgi:L,D-transpeptidase catalytic domain/Sporulation and spore germination/Putative peptidoglycan binding domain